MSLFTMLISGCNAQDDIRTVPSDVFSSEISQSEVQLFDVRTPDEYREGHIEGAINIDVQSNDFLPSAKDQIDPSQPVYVYCRSGKRSMMAAKTLASEGYKVVNLDDGITGWIDSGYPITQQ